MTTPLVFISTEQDTLKELQHGKEVSIQHKLSVRPLQVF